MSTTKDKRLKQLQKWRIWPSVVISFFFLFFSIFVVMTFFGIFILNTVQTKYNDAFNESDKLMQSVQILYDKNYSWDDIIDFVYTTGFTESAAITDSDYSVVASYGKLSFDPDIKNSYNARMLMKDIFGINELSQNKSELIMLSDVDAEDGVAMRDGEFAAIGNHTEKIIYAVLSDLVNRSIDDGSLNEKVFVMDYWLSNSIGDTGYKLVTKSGLSIYRKEIVSVYVICSLCLMILCIPVVFLVINIILGLISRGKMRKLLYTDSITGGKSWLYVQHNAKRYLSGCRIPLLRSLFNSAPSKTAVINMALQKYRSYCTFHGSEAGELLLEQIDKQINQSLQKNEVCARVEKADFVLILHGKSEQEIIDRVYDISKKVRSGQDAAHITWHAGIYAVDGSISDIDLMYNYAGSARATLNQIEDTKAVLFDVEMLNNQIWEHKVEERMDEALENEEFKVYLQPKYDPITENLSGAEALIRWVSPQDGFISPGRFIPIFEKNGFITKIDDYMLAHVAEQQAKWISEGQPVVPISVNISRAHFAQPDLAEHIADIVDRYNVPHNIIEIELTESAFFDDKQVLLNTVNKLKQYGFEISMDDFGAGYSSLNSLKDLPLDVLKLDAEFFRGNSDKKRSETVVAEAIKLAKSLDMKTVAEGIEKKEQVDFLAGQGCDMIQGFYFAKPMPIDEFETKHWKKGNEVDTNL